jgi:hypothetical protein
VPVAAEPFGPLAEQDSQPRAGEQRRGADAPEPAADDDRVVAVGAGL